MSESRFGLPVLYLAIFLLALTGLFAKLIPLDARRSALLWRLDEGACRRTGPPL